MTKLQRKISYILLLLLIFSSFSGVVYGIEDFTSQPVYYGMDKGQAFYNNLRFNDIGGHWGKEPIQEMAALSLLRGTSNTTFNPNGNLTYLEALSVLVRAIGGEAAAQQFGEMEAPATVRNILILSAVDNWAKGYVQVAMDQGIITNEEVNQIMNLTPQQTETLENQIAARLAVYEDRGYTPAELTALQNQIRTKVENNAIWNRPVSRQQVALWVARTLGLAPSYGTDMVRVYNFTDWRQIDTDKIPYVEAILQYGAMTGTSGTTFSPRGNLSRAQMAQILYNINDDLLPLRGLRKKAGTIIEQETVNQQGREKKLYALRNDDNSINYLVVEPAAGQDFVVQNQGELGLSNQLRTWQYVEYYLNEFDEVVYAKVVPSIIEELEGTIELMDMNNKRLALLDYSDNRHLFELEPNVVVTVNGKDAALQDILYGQEVILKLRHGKIIAIEGYLEEDPKLHGYIPPGSRVKVGDVLFVNPQEIEIRVDGNREKYRIVPETLLTRNGKTANLFELKVGDRVILSFDDIYNADIAEIRVEDDERHITGVYRGTLESVNTRNNEIILNNVNLYDQGRWVKHPQQKVKLKIDSNIYRGESALTLKDLEKEIGKEVYTAVENSYGVERAAKTLVKEGSTQIFDSNITALQFGTGRMTVNNNYIYFSPGTIVINNNRLVDRLNLNVGQTVHLAADIKSGVRNAAFVSIQYDGILDDRIDQTKLVVYRGRIDAIAEYGITLSRLAYQIDYLKLENNKWVEIKRPKQLLLTEDTYVFDSEIQKEIDSSYFINSRFINPDLIQDPVLRSRIKNNHYVGKNAFVVVKESTVNGEVIEEILGINLTPNLLHYNNFVQTNHSAMAEIGSVDLDNEKLVLTNIRNWNTLNNRWEAPIGEVTISIDKAIILLNDKPISRDELYRLKERAKVYLVKNKNVSTQDDAYIVIVEQ